jgi:hypothetical protein
MEDLDMLRENEYIELKKLTYEFYDIYKEIYKKEGWILSRQFEIIMEHQLKEENKNDN